MKIELFGRQSTDCSTGTVFYRCAINNFAGCCSVDPCALVAGCPDSPSTGTTSRRDDTTTTTSTSSPTTSPTSSSTTTTTSDDAIITTTAQTPTTETDTPDNSNPDTTPTTLPENTTKNSDESNGGGLSKGAIAGISVGAALLILALIALLFYLRRRRRNRPRYEQDPVNVSGALDNKSNPSPVPASEVEGSPYMTETQSGVSPSISGNGDVFGPFGGRIDRFKNHRISDNSYVSSLTDRTSPRIISQASFNPETIWQLDSTPIPARGANGMNDITPTYPSPDPVELDASPISPTPTPLNIHVPQKRSSPNPLNPVAEDLQATLNSTTSDKKEGRKYVNSWSQYQAS